MAAYTVVQAESHEAAAKLFLNHPHFTIFPGDGVEIMECLPIPGALTSKAAMAKTDYKSVDEYIGAQPVQVRPALQRVRQTIRKALPGASEGISYQIPVFRQDGAMVLFFAGYARHYTECIPAGSP